MKPIYFQDFVEHQSQRREAWRRVYTGAAGWTGREPNAGHHAVARLVAQGKAASVITQNVDNLHQESGVPADQVIELHGNASYAACRTAHSRRRPGVVPRRLSCCRRGSRLRRWLRRCWSSRRLISFGHVHAGGATLAGRIQTTWPATCSLVLGSSLVVYLAAAFPMIAKRNGARPLSIVNREPTEQIAHADLVLHDEIGPATVAAVVPVN